MISRRIIRTKALQILYAYYSTPERSINQSEKELFFSLNKTYDLYHYLIALLLEVADFANKKIEIGRSKLRPSDDELNPNTKFIKNRVIEKLRNNNKLNKYLEQSKLSWVNHPELIKELYQLLSEQDFYKEYMTSTESSYQLDKRFVDNIFNKVILLSEELYEVLEEQSIYWNDDVEFVITMISKTLKKINEFSREDHPLLPKFKDDEDLQFTKDLFRKTIINREDLMQLIKEHAKNWDLDRIAFVDILIMQLAIAEFLYFPTIPTKVTLNEYIEISKFYSTEKSKNFINGILDKTLKQLKDKGEIKKAGRGLIGEA